MHELIVRFTIFIIKRKFFIILFFDIHREQLYVEINFILIREHYGTIPGLVLLQVKWKQLKYSFSHFITKVRHIFTTILSVIDNKEKTFDLPDRYQYCLHTNLFQIDQ